MSSRKFLASGHRVTQGKDLTQPEGFTQGGIGHIRETDQYLPLCVIQPSIVAHFIEWYFFVLADDCLGVS